MAQEGRPACLNTTLARRSGTNRVILNTGWAALQGMQVCKAANVIIVPARNASRTCRACGAVDAASRMTWRCFGFRHESALKTLTVSELDQQETCLEFARHWQNQGNCKRS